MTLAPGTASKSGYSVTAKIGVFTLVAMTVLLAACELESPVVEGSFWFDNVTLDLPLLTEATGHPITDDELEIIGDIARSELRLAYAGLRIRFLDTNDALYRIGVVSRFDTRSGPRSGAVAETVALGAFGGLGYISFEAIATYAVRRAPPDADRDAILAGIGRGLGRAAAHEFAHQLLSGVPLHKGRDLNSYELASANRTAQFYGSLHWEFAWPLLVDRLGQET